MVQRVLYQVKATAIGFLRNVHGAALRDEVFSWENR